MSQENVEIVRTVYERWSEGDLRATVDVFDPKVLLVVPSGFGPDSPEGGTYLGTEAIAAYTRESLLEVWADLTMEADEIEAVGGCVLASVRVRGVGRTSGVPTEMHYFQLWSFRGRKVIRFESFRERAEALEAAGLRE
jgi:ketosteroid isomerase-like protein